MSATTASLPFPVSDTSSTRQVPSAAGLIGGVARYFRSRWIYQRTLTELEFYSERNLRDIGADQGIEEFARRAAGL
jgi:hypothetical protein